MINVTQDTVTDAVVASLGRHGPITDRQREIMVSLLKHLHGFVKDIEMSHDEFLQACDYLGRAGQLCGEKRQEFILLADILGVEVLVDMISNPVEGDQSESTVLGPFYRDNPPVLAKGASTILKEYPGAETVLVEGTIRDDDGNPVAGAIIDTWEDAPNGLYENHDPDQPDYNLRGRFKADENGHFAFVGLRPAPYPIPEDETAGELLRFMGHHPNRPGHLHFIVTANGFRPLITQIYDADSKWLDEDSVFAVKESLIGTFQKAPPGSETDLTLQFDFVLAGTSPARMAAE